MKIGIETSRDFSPALLDELENNPQAISDLAEVVARNAREIATDVLEDAVRNRKYLESDNLTLKVKFEFGNTETDVEDEDKTD